MDATHVLLLAGLAANAGALIWMFRRLDAPARAQREKDRKEHNAQELKSWALSLKEQCEHVVYRIGECGEHHVSYDDIDLLVRRARLLRDARRAWLKDMGRRNG